ncbi:1302_t:CDS:2 [Acaulospora morrowiae]|uniref:1302_t:CDS:1 n=1 Tax=Acaulospora morrowiae TaxID=94023 RepID=A0A9N9FZ26_9GLOM|nr:1302_t:CDS:2 [Acaulospora morrowiae]
MSSTLDPHNSPFKPTSEKNKQQGFVSKESTQNNLTQWTSKRGRVWKYFVTPDISLDGKIRKAICKLPGCGKEIFYRGSSSILRYHLKQCHNIVVNANLNKLATQDQQRILSVNHTVSRKKSKKLDSSNFLQFVKSKNFRYHIPEIAKSQIIDSYDQLFDKLENMLMQVKHVSLAIAVWKFDEHISYMEITCYWLSDDFLLNEILLDIIPIPKFFNEEEISEILDDVFNIWDLHGKTISITRMELWDPIHTGIEDFEYNIGVNCMSYVKDFTKFILEPDLELNIDVFQDKFRELTKKEKDIIKEQAKKIGLGVKNSKQLMTYLVTHEYEFIKKALSNTEDYNADDLLQHINNEPAFILYALEYMIVLENPIRQWIVTLSNNSKTASKARWISNLLPDGMTIRFFTNMDACFKQLKVVMQKLGETKDKLHTLLTEFLNLKRHLETYDKKIEEHASQNQIFINEILARFIIHNIFVALDDKFCNMYYKLALFNPRFDKDMFKDDHRFKKASEDIKQEYSRLRKNNPLLQSLSTDSKLSIDELESYEMLLQHNKSECNDPINWWREHKNEFPTMAKLAQKYLATPLTCYSLEESYSKHCKDFEILMNDLVDFDMTKKFKFLKHNMKYL